MPANFKKIRANSSHDTGLVEQCKRETRCGDCNPLEWITISPPNHDDKIPPRDTTAVVVDVRNYKGAMRIFEAATDEFIGGVGSEDKGYLMIVPWNSNWNYSCVGSLRIGYVTTKT